MGSESQLVEVPFHGDRLQAVQDERGVWVSLRRMCEGLGIDESRQRRKLQSKAWAVADIMSATGPDGKQYESSMLHLDCVPMWLATIETSRTKPEIRSKLELYQRECAKVLADYFRGTVKPATTGLSSAMQQEISDMILTQLQDNSAKVLASVQGMIAQKHAPEPHYTIKDRIVDLGWRTATGRQKDQVRQLFLHMVARAGHARPVRESGAPGSELLVPGHLVPLLDDCIMRIWDEVLESQKPKLNQGQQGQMWPEA